jgi:hypothetical protein
MTIVISPKPGRTPTPPAVGIFWRVNDVLVVDRSTLDVAEPYGDCITHAAGHYERWQEWQASGGTRMVSMGYPMAILSTEYDEWPRSRVIYETPMNRFVIYADRRLQKPDVIDAVTTAFRLDGAEIPIRSDAHYR